MPHQAAKELQKDSAGETLPEHHKGQLSLVSDCGDHVATKPLPGSRHHRDFAQFPSGSPGLVVRTQSLLVAQWISPPCALAFRLIPG